MRHRSNVPATALALAVLAVGFTANREASAVTRPPILEWEPLGTGAASAIAVGANDIPWILGCGGGNCNDTGYEQAVYYLRWSTSNCPDPQFCIPSPEWIYDNFNAMTLAVDVNGVPFATDTTGTISKEYEVVSSPPPVTLPNGQWQTVGRGAVSAFAAGVFVDYYGGSGEYFYPAPTGNAPSGALYEQTQFWGTGCGSACGQGPFDVNAGIYHMTAYQSEGNANNTWSGWSQLPGGATRLALFTDPPIASTAGNGSDTNQTLWVLNSAGQVFYWTGYSWNQQPGPYGLSIVSLTDHYVLASNGETFSWTGASDGASPSTASGTSNGWYPVLGAMTTTNTLANLKQIAASQGVAGAFVGQSAEIGPSEIWAIDYSGTIYRAVWVNQSTPE